MARSPDPRATRNLPATLPAVVTGVLLLLATTHGAARPAAAGDSDAAQSPPPAASAAPVNVVQRAKDAVQQSNDATARHSGQDADAPAQATAKPAAKAPEANAVNSVKPAKPAKPSDTDAVVASSPARPAAKNKAKVGGKSLVIVSGSSSTAPAQVSAPSKRAPVTASNAAKQNAADGASAAQAKSSAKQAKSKAKAGSAAAPTAAGNGDNAQVASATANSVTQVDAAGPAGSDDKTSPTVSVPKLAPQEERVTYQYNALGRRDPFRALIGGGFVGMDVGGDAPPDVGGLTVVGIVWGAQDKFALCEDPRGNSMVLRKGDKVMNGVVEELKRDGLVITLSTDGQTQSVTIPLTQKGEQAQ